MERKTQQSEVLKYLQNHEKGLTSMKAFELFGVTRLASIIHELRRKHAIETIYEEGKNRFGGYMQYARYVLHDED